MKDSVFETPGGYKTKADTIYEYLKEEIMNGKLRPGDRILLSKVAKGMGSSEIPVRESIRRLETERLVSIVPHAGAKVTGVSIDNIVDIYSTRAIVEGAAAGLAATTISDEQLGKIGSMLRLMEESHSKGKIEDFAKIDKAFHIEIYNACANKHLCQLVMNLWNETQRARSVFNLRADRLSSFLSDHKLIYSELCKKNAQAVEKLVKQHRLDVATALIEYDRQRGEGTSIEGNTYI